MRKRNLLIVLTIGLCALGFALVPLLPGGVYGEYSHNNYLMFHTVAEILSVIVSFSVFAVGWQGYAQNRSKQDLVIGTVFLVVGILDFVHTLSYSGMPNFLSPNTVSKASTYWIAARLVNGFGLLVAAFVPTDSGRKWVTPHILAGAGVAFAATVIVVESFYPSLIPAMYVEGVGQTTLKIGLEWLVIIAYAGAIFAFGRGGRRQVDTVLLQLALIIGISSELCFTLYRSAFDDFNLLGHLYKLAATYLIFRALFVSSLQRPYYALMAARDQIERSFARIGDALASSPELDKSLQLIAELASDILGSKAAAVMLMQDGHLYVKAQRGMIEHPSQIPVEHTSAGLAISTRRPITVANVNDVPGHNPKCHCQRLDDRPARSVVSAPIMTGDDILGVIEVYSPEENAYGPKEAELLYTFARQAAVAIRNSMAYERERTVAQTFQKSLLPPAPVIPGLDIAVLYQPAEDIARVGGDLYDVVELDDDNIALVIGDVCGHGLQAASVMAMTSYMLKGSLTRGMSPSEALHHVNVALCRGKESEEDLTPAFVTVFAAVLNIRTKELSYSNAGHHMPMILRDGVCESVERLPGLPLAIDESAVYETQTLSLTEASGLLLYTDGVVEARRQGDLFGDDRLHEICVEATRRPASELLASIVERARAWSGILNDDVAAVAVKWEAEG